MATLSNVKFIKNLSLKMFILGFAMVYLVTAELYPTNMRTQAVGFSSTVARVFCACAPFLGQLAKYWEPAPMVLIGVPILMSGLLVLKLPETFNRALPQTLKGAKEMEMENVEA